jgi:hypothetical protein
MSDFSGWSCDERDRKNCRNGHGCHCREITSLIERNSMLENSEAALRNLRIDPAIYAKPQDGGETKR